MRQCQTSSRWHEHTAHNDRILMKILQVPLDAIQLATKTCALVIAYQWLACPDSIHRPWRPVAAVPVVARPEASLHGPEGPH